MRDESDSVVWSERVTERYERMRARKKNERQNRTKGNGGVLERIMKRKKVCSSESVEENTLIEEIRKKKRNRNVISCLTLVFPPSQKKRSLV